MARHKTSIFVSGLLLFCLFLAGCGGGTGGNSFTITITSAQSSIPVSGTEVLTATVVGSNGISPPITALNWTSSATNVATITPSGGLVFGLLPGTTQITASASGVTSDPFTLTVTPGFLGTGNMNDARDDETETLLDNGMVLVAGGYGSDGPLASAELFNPATGAFTPTGSMNTARYWTVATLLSNGKVLIAGGYNDGGFLASAELYDPASGTFTFTGNLNTPRRLFTSTLLNNGQILIAGGYGASGALNSAELYDPVTGTFAPTGSMNEPRRITTSTLLNNGMVLIAGGLNASGTLADAELYNPATGSFSITGSMSAARYYHTATLLNNGRVLIAGGYTPNGYLASAELFDSATGQFSATGSLNTARSDATATLLNNGTVLIAGGEGGTLTNYFPQSSAELYDPSTGKFTLTGSLNAARVAFTAALLENGTVLVAGGADSNRNAESSAELYEPGLLTPPGLESITVAPASPTASPSASSPRALSLAARNSSPRSRGVLRIPRSLKSATTRQIRGAP